MHNQEIKAIFFDLDGTLIDSLKIWEEIDYKFLSELKLVEPENMKSEIEGLSFEQTAVYFKRKFNLTMSVEEIIQSWFRQVEDAYHNHIEVISGAYQILDYFYSSSIQLILLTSNRRDLVDAILNRLLLGKYFPHRHYNSHKERPQTYQELIARYKIKPEQAWMIDDALATLLAAKQTGLKTAWTVIGKTDKQHELNKHRHPDYVDFIVHNSLDELKSLVT
ncbi:MAG: HAD family hydrolase [bacterium]